MCVGVFACMYVCTPCVCLVAEEAGRVWQVPWNWGHRQLEAAIWFLGTEPSSAGSTASALDLRGVSPVSELISF